jgi:hypothetical protein
VNLTFADDYWVLILTRKPSAADEDGEYENLIAEQVEEFTAEFGLDLSRARVEVEICY